MNETTPSFETVLASCLDAVLRGEQTIAECLQRYPHYADDLRPLLQTALLTRRLPSPTFVRVDVLEARLRRQMVRQRQTRIVAFPTWGRIAAAVALVLLLTFGSGAGLVSASADTIPGDSLYGVKRLWEQIVLSLASMVGQLSDVSLALAEERLEEVEKLAQRGHLTDEALQELTLASERAALYNRGSPEFDAYLQRVRSTMRVLPLPAVVQETLELTIQTLEQPLVGTGPATATPMLTSTAAAPTAITPTALPPTEVTVTSENVQMLMPTTMASPTERFAATATRTPSPTPLPTRPLETTPAPAQSVTPSPTWTDLPRQGSPIIIPVTVTPPPGVTVVEVPATINPSVTIPVRQTPQAVYMTQTAQAQATTSPTP